VIVRHGWGAPCEDRPKRDRGGRSISSVYQIYTEQTGQALTSSTTAGMGQGSKSTTSDKSTAMN
jgi:hypothetical protein